MVNPGPVPHVGGPAKAGSPNVFFDNLDAMRVGDPFQCVGPPTTCKAATGSSAVLINGKRAVRIGDSTNHGGVVVGGSSGIWIGDTGDISISKETAGKIFVDGKVLVACGCPPDDQAATMSGAKGSGQPYCEVCSCLVEDGREEPLEVPPP